MRDPNHPAAILFAEVDGAIRAGKSGTAAWREVLRRPRKAETVAIETNSTARDRAFAEGALSPEQQGVRMTMSDARTIGGTSVQKVRPTPGVPAAPPLAERKPGETQEQFRLRLRRQIEALAQPAGTPDVSLSAEKSEATYAVKRAALLNSEAAQSREKVRLAEARTATRTEHESAVLRASALGIMASRHQSTDTHAKDFSENYKRALAEAAKGAKR